MKITHTLMLSLFLGVTSLNAGEPLIFNTAESGAGLLKIKPAASSNRKALRNSDGETNIAIKMNLTQLAMKNLSFQGEYGFHRKMSVALGFSRLLTNTLPASVYSGNEYMGPLSYKGYAITPEFRFYPGGREDKPAPNGFYIGAYVRYANYKADQSISYYDEDNDKLYTGEAKQTYGGVNGGLMIGRQWIIGKHFTIDWWIVGAGYGKAKYTYGWVSRGQNLSPEEQQDVREAAEVVFKDISAFGLNGSVETTRNSATMNVRGVPMFSLRFMGLCLGYAF